MSTQGLVIFDAFNTLVTSRRGSKRTFLAVLVQAGIRAVLVENAAIHFDLGDRDVDDRRSCLFVWSIGSLFRCCPG